MLPCNSIFNSRHGNKLWGPHSEINNCPTASARIGQSSPIKMLQLLQLDVWSKNVLSNSDQDYY